MKKYDKKNDERFSNPFGNLEKASVLQETRTFNETPINTKKCCLILTKILYMINQVISSLIHSFWVSFLSLGFFF